MEAHPTNRNPPQRFTLVRTTVEVPHPTTPAKTKGPSSDDDLEILHDTTTIAAPMSSMYTTGYRPRSMATQDPGKVIRSDGTYYDQNDPPGRAYENSENKFGKNWIRDRIESLRRLEEDWVYKLARGVAGKTHRTVEDLLANPIEYGGGPGTLDDSEYYDATAPAPPPPPPTPAPPRPPAPRSSAPEPQEENTLWLPDGIQYSLEVLARELDEADIRAYVEALHRGERENGDKIIRAGLMRKWTRVAENDPTFAKRLPKDPGPSSQETTSDRRTRATQLVATFDAMLKDKKAQLTPVVDYLVNANPATKPFRSVGQAVKLKQDIAEISMIVSTTIEPAGEYRSILGPIETIEEEEGEGSPSIQYRRNLVEALESNEEDPIKYGVELLDAVEQWDTYANGGRLADARSRYHRDRMRRARENPDQGPSPPHPPPPPPPGRRTTAPPATPASRRRRVDRHWIGKPENLGILNYSEGLISAVDTSLSDILLFDSGGFETTADVMMRSKLRDVFIQLVAANLRISEVATPKRNENPAVLLPELKRLRLVSLVQICRIGIGAISYGRAEPLSRGKPIVYVPGHEREDQKTFRYASEVKEYERSREIFERLLV